MGMSMSVSVGRDGDKGVSRDMGTGVGSADSALCIGEVRRKPGPKEHLASKGDAHSTGAPTPKVLGAENMGDPLSKGIPFVGLRLQTCVTRQRPADVKFLQATDGSTV